MTELTICGACNGNGFVRVPHSIYAEARLKISSQWEVVQCDVCRSSGEAQSSLRETEEGR